MSKLFCPAVLLLLFSQSLSAQSLIEATEAKNYQAVEQYIKDGEKVNKPNKKGQFPLWVAVWNQDDKMVELLIKNGADAKQKFKGKDGKFGCLEIAAQEGLLEITKLLITAGADPNERDLHGHTPLRIAARNGRTGLVTFFISKGCEVDTKGDDGATPLEHAAGKGHLEIVKILLENGANVNHQDNDKDSPLGEAAKSGFIEIVNLLLSKGADTTLKNKDGYTAEALAKISGQAKVEEILKQKAKG
jgi:ankyrin repeat protein